jgi:peptidyl-prolyl cis-trans isomerase SurA
MAQQFSESTSSATGGYIGWFAQGQMDSAIESAVLNLNPGEFTQPIRTGMGYKIIYLKDLKKPHQAPIGQTQITYKQVAIPYHDNITNEQYTVIETHINEMQAINSCESLESKANEHGYQCDTAKNVSLGGLPPVLQKMFHATKVKQCLKPIRTPQHLIVTMVCSRDMPAIKMPTDEEIRSTLEQEKFGKIATREFNKLHSIGFIEDKTVNEAKGATVAAAAAA